MKVDYPWLQNPYYENENQRFSKREFLKTIDGFLNQRQYFKITLLDWNEKAIKDIQGKIVSGTMTKTGSSAVRRTCNISCAVGRGEYDPSAMSSDFAINKKIFLEVGIKNETEQYTDYPILWFPQGMFFISTFSITSATSSSINISLGLKDKMAMLDGSVGGRFPATTQLDVMTTQTFSGQIVEEKVRINDLIIEIVNHFGGEQIPNIVVEDIPNKIRKYIRWMNDEKPLYIYREADGSYDVSDSIKEKGTPIRICEYGDDIGFTYEDFVYDSEFTVAANSTVTAALDTLKNYLGNFEYFYDEFGVFHFREIKNYLNTSKSTQSLNDMDAHDYLMETSSMGKSMYTFSDNSNIISITNTPQYENIRNDITVLGTKKSTDTNLTYEVRYHVAIDKKPEINKRGYKNILVYKDPDTKRYTLTIPTILNGELPSFGNLDTIYGILDYSDTMDITTQYTKDDLIKISTQENSSLGILLPKKEDLSFGDIEIEKKRLLNNLVFLSEAIIDLYLDKESLSVNTIEKRIRNYIQKIQNMPYYLSGELGTDYNILNEKIYSQAALLQLINEKAKQVVTNYGSEDVNEICGKFVGENGSVEIDTDNEFAAIIDSLNNHIETCNLLIENYKSTGEDTGNKISLLEEEIKNLNMQIAWYQSRKKLQDIIEDDSSTSSVELPAKTYTVMYKKPRFWYWNNEWVELEWTKYYSENGLYENPENLTEDLIQQTNYGTDNKTVTIGATFGDYSYVAKDWRTEIILQGLQAKANATDNNSYYYEELIGNWPTIYDLNVQEWANKTEDNTRNYKTLCDGYFFLDIIDNSSDIYGEYSVSNIGRRQLVDVSNDINCLFEPDVLPIGFLLEKNVEDKSKLQELKQEIQKSGLKLFNVGEDKTYLSDYFATGGLANDAFTKIKYDLLTHTNYQNTIALSAIPVWYLEPNVIITISDYSTKTFGDYMVQSVSYTFGAGNAMTINCSKTIEKM